MLISPRFQNDAQFTLSLCPIQQAARQSVLQKLAAGVYAMENTSCLCGQQDDDVLAEKDRYGLPVRTVICRQCGQLRTSPRMTAQSYQQFYQHDYRPLYVGAAEASEEFFGKQYGHGRQILTYLQSQVPQLGNKVLEIGCGAGGILYAFQQQGFEVCGIDLGSNYLEYGRQQGLNLLHKSSRQLLQIGAEQYDVIILSHVLEHFLDIPAELEVIHQLLKTDGILYIEVPGLAGLKQRYQCDFLRYLQNAHTYHFTRATLNSVLASSGYQCLHSDDFIHSMFQKCAPHQLATDANEYRRTLEFLQDLEQNRSRYQAEAKLVSEQQRQQKFTLLREKLAHYPAKSVYLYGTGQHSRLLLNALAPSQAIGGLLDADPAKAGSELFGYKVATLEDALASMQAIVISSDVYQDMLYLRLKKQIPAQIELLRIY
ncbi:class I SAM-dependent methyltransferase [Alkalimonas amylolytica]|uniref:Methyltransferase domain-containing protein n=1 Tax=Alkalimonas amylolytica TaxID=152573 RepID=A0A1H4B838_ALKAM|nr:class I SAM-dependent methyltransferase [Alkalimonas amylolytica]SEA44310.1 Methyltransferase domain-containing protein [Alkalimonas amylolytica]